MKPLILTLVIVLSASCLSAQSNTDTISTIFSKHGTISGDTVFFHLPGPGASLKRYFNKTLRSPMTENDAFLFGYIDLYFTIDKAGSVTQAWYNQDKNPEVAAGVMRNIQKFPVFRPTVIGNNAVITKMLMKVAILDGKAENFDALRITAEAKADVIMVSYRNRKMRVMTGSTE